MRALAENGSMMSGLFGDMETSGFDRLDWEAENGGEERRRIAWVIVGWKRPPCAGEYALRCVGRTWPRVKKVERALRVSVNAVKRTNTGESTLIFETDVITP